MKFLKEKFNDKASLVDQFLLEGNALRQLEDRIELPLKKEFVKGFLDKLELDGVITPELRAVAPEKNPWSIDFPSWYGAFDEKKGKRFFIIGSEPHIHFEYLQTVYQLNGENTGRGFHEIFTFLSAILPFENHADDSILNHLYLTDLFPLAPLGGHGHAVGSTARLEELVRHVGDWRELRYKYASVNLPLEIEAVKPDLILTQGSEVLKEVIKILGVSGKPKSLRIESRTKGVRDQHVKLVEWHNYRIASVPHPGTKRHKAFYRLQIDDVKSALSRIIQNEI